MKVDVLGVSFENATLEETVNRAMGQLDGEGAPQYVVTPNPEIVMTARKDEEFRRVLNGAFLVLPDGIGVVYGARILGRPIRERIPGIDFITALFEKMAGRRVFLLGAKPGVAEQAARNLSTRFPELVLCGTNDGYFTDDGPVIEKINTAAPDLLLVCLGAPKQEKWMAANAGRLNVRLMAGLGGSLDVFAGIVERAPEKWRRLGLEWLYRLLKEPKRIGRMMKLPKFLLVCMGRRVRSGKNG